MIIVLSDVVREAGLMHPQKLLCALILVPGCGGFNFSRVCMNSYYSLIEAKNYECKAPWHPGTYDAVLVV